MRATRLNALLNAALGYVASETSGFVDFDAVPEQGASLQVGWAGIAGMARGRQGLNWCCWYGEAQPT